MKKFKNPWENRQQTSRWAEYKKWAHNKENTGGGLQDDSPSRSACCASLMTHIWTPEPTVEGKLFQELLSDPYLCAHINIFNKLENASGDIHDKIAGLKVQCSVCALGSACVGLQTSTEHCP